MSNRKFLITVFVGTAFFLLLAFIWSLAVPNSPWWASLILFAVFWLVVGGITTVREKKKKANVSPAQE